jgi:ribonucleoside-diphosphate reductase alpha chain
MWLIKSAAYRGKWVDQSQSLNIYFHGTSGKDLSDIYVYAWEMGLKTTYYLRTLAISQVEKSTVNTTDYGSTHLRKTGTSFTTAGGTPVQTTSNTNTTPTMIISNETPVNVSAVVGKACAIDDPTCESCQS